MRDPVKVTNNTPFELAIPRPDAPIPGLELDSPEGSRLLQQALEGVVQEGLANNYEEVRSTRACSPFISGFPAGRLGHFPVNPIPV